ncbi:MAG: hypothetical protein QOE79_139 [Sphingomonadales bacterium]|nr:hypothetical protein [Sphingomonadales bacterium]MEA3048697.1 hypothetical protein [Sphingomonadales bacterium]
MAVQHGSAPKANTKPGRDAWTSPRVKRLAAGAAENGAGPKSDAIITYS